MSTAKCQIPVERVLQVRPKAMGIDVGHINDPQCGQGFHQEGAQELTAQTVIIANPAVLRIKEIECRRLRAEHVPVFPKGVDDATDFRVGQPLVDETGFKRPFHNQFSLAGFADESLCLSALSTNMVDAIEFVKVVVGEEAGDPGAKLLRRKLA